MILRIIQGQVHAEVSAARDARRAYQKATGTLVSQLSPEDFEQLIDLILNRSGWVRRSRIGNVTEGVDIEADNPAVDETAFVQVKSSANQRTFNDYVRRFSKRRQAYTRIIFAVHTQLGKLQAPANRTEVQLW